MTTTTPKPTEQQEAWLAFENPKLIIVKLGSQLLMDEKGRVAIHRMADVVEQCATLREQGCRVVLVSSGSVSLGQLALGLSSPLSETHRRACAAVGQAKLVQAYEQLFEYYGIQVAQLLINTRHFAERWHYVSIGNTLESLLSMNIMPIVNENDTLADPTQDEQTESFGDNDKLAALLSVKLDADGLLMLSNVSGVFTANPAEDPSAKRVPLITSLEQLDNIKIGKTSKYGRGGMEGKLEAAKITALCGVPSVIGSGIEQGLVDKIVNYKGKPEAFPATYIAPFEQPAYAGDGYKRWLALSSGYTGVVCVNEGAVRALRKDGASLLPVGITEVRGEFLANQVVSIRDMNDHEIGRGLSSFSSADLQRLIGVATYNMEDCLGYEPDSCVAVHRSRLVMF